MNAGGQSPQQFLAGAVEAMRRGDAAAPVARHVKMQKALIHRMTGALPSALAALDEALALDPYNFLALLSKGAIVEKLSGERLAAKVYENAIKLAPAEAN